MHMAHQDVHSISKAIHKKVRHQIRKMRTGFIELIIKEEVTGQSCHKYDVKL